MKSNSNNIIYQSGDLTIHPQSGQIKAQGELIKLGPVNMQVLITLLERHGEVVSRGDLFDQVWKNQIVSDDTLTRCISDLRTQLGKLADGAKLIETLPKRGYRWIIPVSIATSATPQISPAPLDHSDSSVSSGTQTSSGSQLSSGSQVSAATTTTSGHPWRKYSGWLVASLLSLLILSTSALWLVEKLVRPQLVRVALIPLQVSQAQHKSIAADLNEVLSQRLLATSNIRFIAQSAVASRPQNPFPYLAREFSTQWVIEGKIRDYQDKPRVSLSLVDARSAIVVYTLTQDVDLQADQIEVFCNSFIEQMKLALKPADY